MAELQPRRHGALVISPVLPTACLGVGSFGVRQLAAAFLPASLLAGIATESIIARQQAGSSQSGSKLPHSKASLRMPGVKVYGPDFLDGAK